MIERKIVALEGFEDEFNLFTLKKERLHEEIFAKAQKDFEEKTEKFNRLLAEVSREVEVEVPDVVEEQPTEQPNAEENVGE